ncbi:unnamed protein product [Natator depressus]
MRKDVSQRLLTPDFPKTYFSSYMISRPEKLIISTGTIFYVGGTHLNSFMTWGEEGKCDPRGRR